MGHKEDKPDLATQLFVQAFERKKRNDAAVVVRTWLNHLAANDHRTETTTGRTISEIAETVLTGLKNGEIYFIVKDEPDQPLRARAGQIKIPPGASRIQPLTDMAPDTQSAVNQLEHRVGFVGLQLSPTIRSIDANDTNALRELTRVFDSHLRTPCSLSGEIRVSQTDVTNGYIVLGRIGPFVSEITPKDPTFGAFPAE